MTTTAIYMVKRQPQPGWHLPPYYPVVICTRLAIAREQAGDSGQGAWIWEHHIGPFGGFLLRRWNGLDLDYGYVVKGIRLPDGDERAFDHEHAHPETWALLSAAVWWSPRKMPSWLADRGVVYPPDDFTRYRILDDYANDGMSGFRNRGFPAWWTS